MTSKEEEKFEKAECTTVRAKICEVEGRAGRDRKTERACTAKKCLELEKKKKMFVTQTSSEDMLPHRGYPSRSGDSYRNLIGREFLLGLKIPGCRVPQQGRFRCFCWKVGVVLQLMAPLPRLPRMWPNTSVKGVSCEKLRMVFPLGFSVVFIFFVVKKSQMVVQLKNNLKLGIAGERKMREDWRKRKDVRRRKIETEE